MYVCLFDLRMFHCHGDLKQGKYLVWDVLCFGEVWFSSVPVTCCRNTHTLPFPRTRSNNTHKHTSTPWTPYFSPTGLSSSVCLSCIADLSVHLFIRSTEGSISSQMIHTALLAEWSSYTTACHPDHGIQTRCLTEGINHLCLHSWPARLLSTRPGAGAGAKRYCRHRRQCVVGAKRMEWNSAFQKSQSNASCYSLHSWWISIFQKVYKYSSGLK